MNRQYCDKCGKESNDDHVLINWIDDFNFKIDISFECEGQGEADLCDKCKLKILKEITKKGFGLKKE